jgi:hypothetical protein
VPFARSAALERVAGFAANAEAASPEKLPRRRSTRVSAGFGPRPGASFRDAE